MERTVTVTNSFDFVNPSTFSYQVKIAIEGLQQDKDCKGSMSDNRLNHVKEGFQIVVP